MKLFNTRLLGYHFCVIMIVSSMAYPLQIGFSELSVEVDKELYSPTGDYVYLTGKLDYIPDNNSVIIKIIDPYGNLLKTPFSPVDQNGVFTIKFTPVPTLILEPGIYTVTVIGLVDGESIVDTTTVTINVKPILNQTTNYDQKQNGGCLIATATFGSELSPQVQELREIRDDVVLETESGRLFMTSFNKSYYSFSPAISDLERKNYFVKEIIKIGIIPLLSTLSLLNIDPHISEEELIFYGVILIGLNIMIYFLIPTIFILKLKNFLTNRVNSKSKHLT